MPGPPPAYTPPPARPPEPPPHGRPPAGAPPYGTGAYPAVGEPAYEPAYPSAPYGGDPAYGPYDAATEVFDRGLLTDPYADAHTGVIPVSPPVDAGPRGGFAPPPSGGYGPQPPGYGPQSTGFGSPPAGFGPTEPEPLGAEPVSDPWRASDDDHEAPLFSRFRRIRSHARQRRSRRWVAVVLVLALIGAAAGLRFWPGSPWYHGKPEESAQEEPMPLRSTAIDAGIVGAGGFLSWAYEDLRNGTVTGSDNMTETTGAGPLLTAWFGADVLRRAAENGVEPTETQLADIEAMIRDEDLAAADRVVASLAGTEDSIDRLRTMCHLANLTPVPGSWQDTAISAQDAARMGGCLADGRAAGAQWTPWLLNVMRQVRGEGGIRQAFPPGERAMIAVTNGMRLDPTDGQWRANCLAVTKTWSLAVLQRVPATENPNSDVAHVEAVCQQVAQQLSAP